MELRELLHAARKSVDRKRSMQRLVMRQRRGAGSVSPLCLDPTQCLLGPLEHEFVGVAVLGRRGAAARQRQVSEPCAEVVVADRGREALAGGASVLGVRARQYHDELIADAADEIVLTRGMADDLGDCADSRLSDSAVGRRVDFDDEKRHRLPRNGAGYGGFGGGSKLVGRPIEMRQRTRRLGSVCRNSDRRCEAPKGGAINEKPELRP